MEGDDSDEEEGKNESISIHSLRMEGDAAVNNDFSAQFISIHSLRMEGDSTFAPLVQIALSFQSTPSAWRETSLPPP